jgi:hypothetical protein
MRIKRVFFIVAFVLSVHFALAETFKPERYEEAELKELQTSPEKYKGKKVYVKTIFKGFLSTFPNYFEKNGIKPEKYYCMIIQPWNVSIILKKKSDLGDMVADIKNMSELKIYGKIKKFTRAARNKRWPKYYFEPDYIEVIKSGEENLKAKEAALEKQLEKLRNRRKSYYGK